MSGLIRNEYAVLSTYVPRLEEMGINANERWEVRPSRLLWSLTNRAKGIRVELIPRKEQNIGH